MPTILFIAPAYRQYPVLIHSLQMLTHKDWQLLLVHDGPNPEFALTVQRIDEPRVRYCETESHTGNYGHAVRDWALEQVASQDIPGDYIVITNTDNYYVPGFVDLLLPAFEEGVVAVYCNMLHNYIRWSVLDAQLFCGGIDGGAIMVSREAALEVRWKSRQPAADWDYINDLIQRYGADRIRKVPQILFVHN